MTTILNLKPLIQLNSENFYQLCQNNPDTLLVGLGVNLTTIRTKSQAFDISSSGFQMVVELAP